MFNLIGLKKGVLKRATSATYGATRPAAHNNRSHVSGAYAGEELNALRETADEWVRSTNTGFIRVFPSPTSHLYTSFFEKPRRLNTLLREWFFPGPAPTRRSFAITAGVSYSRQLSHGVRGVSAGGNSPSVVSTRKRASTAKKKRRQEAEELALTHVLQQANRDRQYHTSKDRTAADASASAAAGDDIGDSEGAGGEMQQGANGARSTSGEHFGMSARAGRDQGTRHGNDSGSVSGSENMGLDIVSQPTRSASAGPGRSTSRARGARGSTAAGKGKQRAPSPYLTSPAASASRPHSSTAALAMHSASGQRVKGPSRPQSGLPHTRNTGRDVTSGSRSGSRARGDQQGTAGAQPGNGRLRRTASYAYGAGAQRGQSGTTVAGNGRGERIARTRASSASRRTRGESANLPKAAGARPGRIPSKTRRGHIPKIVQAPSKGTRGTTVPAIAGGRNTSQGGRSKAVSSSAMHRFKSSK
eukprot:TRINITY_DN13458_c0_g1_i21.p1 TRINITY_DN13458_c0_g1~~TRINITY_DN13458_c0_g1_i21.p1  ORF type:complete len:473 (+),score=56.31 TRINITY_DN13458_c0_g1_i21:96-1514(+)